VADPPTIYEWAGGTDAFERWLNAFYDLVEEDDGLAPLFGGPQSAGIARVVMPTSRVGRSSPPPLNAPSPI
jgi:truncated hemoglobin YjbI